MNKNDIIAVLDLGYVIDHAEKIMGCMINVHGVRDNKVVLRTALGTEKLEAVCDIHSDEFVIDRAERLAKSFYKIEE